MEIPNTQDNDRLIKEALKELQKTTINVLFNHGGTIYCWHNGEQICHTHYQTGETILNCVIRALDEGWRITEINYDSCLQIIVIDMDKVEDINHIFN